MSDIQLLIQKNTMVKRLIAEGNLTQDNLKKLFRHLSKITHPDIKNEDTQDTTAEFIRLKDEYDEAVQNLDRIKTFLIQRGPAGNIHGTEDIQRMFFSSLRHYLAAGMNSQRMRIRPEMRKRNDLILREIVYWAKLYDPAFIPLFLNYNKTYLRRFTEWKKRDEIMRAKQYFFYGFHDSITYEENRSPRLLRAAYSNFRECINLLSGHAEHPFAKAMRECAAWFILRLDILSAPPKKKGVRHSAAVRETDFFAEPVIKQKDEQDDE